MNLKALINWSQREFSDLPWRKNRTLYRTLVSEIMLQQTTVSTVRNHFERFLEKFPTLEKLSFATEEEVLIAWKGLGYYRRAKSLKKIAETIRKEYKGKFPDDAQELMQIQGIGPYTSQALVAIGMNKRGLAIDANLERVISRLYGIKVPKGPALQKYISALFENKKIMTDDYSFRELNEALMDLGRTFCQARKASCELCPLNVNCLAAKRGQPLLYPMFSLENKKSEEHELHLLRLYVRKGKKLLVFKKNDDEWLTGQYEVPTLVLNSTDKNLKQYTRTSSIVDTTKAIIFKTSITKYKITNYALEINLRELKTLGFKRKVEWKDIEGSNFSIATLKGLIEKEKSCKKRLSNRRI